MASTLPEPRPVSEPPKDGITAISYSSQTLLASTSWDGSVRLHDTVDMQCKLSHFLESGPLLSLATPAGDTTLLTGGADGSSEYLYSYFPMCICAMPFDFCFLTMLSNYHINHSPIT